MNKLLKDAIADAKAVRETALANAKATLEEAFAPKLQSMLSHKIKEELDELPTEEEPEMEPTAKDGDMEEAARMRSLAGIAEVGDEDDMEGDEAPPPAPEESPEDAPVGDVPPAEGEAEMQYSDDDGDEDLGGDEPDGDEGEEVSDEELAELLRELEGSEDEDEDKMEEPLSEAPEAAKGEDEPEADEEEVDLDEIIQALKEEDEEDEDDEDEKANGAAVVQAKAELQEAYSVIKFLRSKLNEVNLLNAKLLFVSKLFKRSELTEAQKVRIIETFDRVKTVREAKLVYTTLVESVRTKSTAKPPIKKKMTEGLASAAQKKTEVIQESNSQFDRFKTLMNFNKH